MNILSIYTPRNEYHSGYRINYTFDEGGERYRYELLDPAGEWIASGWSPNPENISKFAHVALEKHGVDV